MLNAEIKKIIFKVKKVKTLNGEEVQGIVYPAFDKYLNDFSEEKVNFKTLDGRDLNLRLSITEKFKTTKITNADVKAKVELAIESLKEIYKAQKKIISLSKEINLLTDNVEKFSNKATKMINESIIISGKIPQKDFENEIEKEKISTRRSNVYSNVYLMHEGTKVTGLKLEQEAEIGKYLNESSYDFLYTEYDGCLMIECNFNESKDFKNILNKHIYFLPKNLKIDGCTISEYDDAQIGDKNILFVSHYFEIKFKKPRDFDKETLKLLKSIIKKFKNAKKRTI